MKNTVKWVIIAVVLVGVIAGASVLYNKFSEDYIIESPVQTTAQSGEQDGQGESEQDFSAPDFTVLDYDGKEVNLSDFKGKPVVINFWATWCYYCKEEMPDFNEAFKKYPDVEFLMINATDGYQETIESAKKYIEEEGFDFNAYFDTEFEAVNAYYVNGYPATFFIDKDGNLVTYANGMLDYESLEKRIELIK